MLASVGCGSMLTSTTQAA